MSRYLLLFLLIAVAGCDTNDPGECIPGVDPQCTEPQARVVVGNQGVFSDNSGSLTLYDPDADSVLQGAAPGGLVQRVYAGNIVTSAPETFALLNFDDSFSTGSGRIVELDPTDGSVRGSVAVGTPRDMVVTEGGRAFVSDLYGAAVTSVSLADLAVGDTISVGDNPEGLAAVGDRVYVANSGFGFGTTLSVIDATAGVVTETLEDVCFGPRALLVDAEAEVWVFCTGYSDFTTGAVVENGTVVVLDGATGDEVARIEVEGILGAASLGQDASIGSSEAFVILGQEILRFDTVANTLAGRFTVGGSPISAVGYDPRTDRLYLGRLDAANPFSASGFVTIHDLDGTEIGRFDAGVVPGSIAFLTLGVEG